MVIGLRLLPLRGESLELALGAGLLGATLDGVIHIHQVRSTRETCLVRGIACLIRPTVGLVCVELVRILATMLLTGA